MRVILGILLMLLGGQFVFGQSSYRNPYFTPFSQYYFQQSMINPAYVGNENQPQFWASYQSSKEQFGTGKAFNALFQGRMYNAPINYGFIFAYEDFNDDRDVTNFSRRGDIRQMMAGLQGSFDFDVGENGIGRVGLTGALLYHNNDLLSASVPAGDQNLRKVFPSLDIGIIMIYGNFEMGMSVTNSNQPKFGLPNVSTTGGGGVTVGTGGVSTGGAGTTFKRSSYVTFLYNWKVVETLSLHPQVLVRLGDGQLSGSGGGNGGINGTGNNNNFRLNGLSLDLAMLINYYDLAFLGLSYKPPLGQTTAFDFVYKYNYATIMTGLRIANAYQVSLSWDLIRPGVNNKEDYRKFELGIGAFLFDNFYFEDDDVPVDY